MSTHHLMLDTNAASAYIRGQSEALDRLLAGQPLCISVITEAELRYGLARKPQATALARSVQAFLDVVPVLPWTSEVAQTYAVQRAGMADAGLNLSALDGLSAAHAVAEHCTLVTADRAFANVPNLHLQAWAETSAH